LYYHFIGNGILNQLYKRYLLDTAITNATRTRHKVRTLSQCSLLCLEDAVCKSFHLSPQRAALNCVLASEAPYETDVLGLTPAPGTEVYGVKPESKHSYSMISYIT
jgi:hypothetical protein